MFKRILKIVSICLAGFIVIVGAGFGIFALTGGFKTVTINIIKLYMDDANKADKTIKILEDQTVKLNFEPYNATNTKLEVVVSDPMRIEDENGNVIKEGILKNVPKTVNAGSEFNIEINKDVKGNNIGGVATLTFRPAGDEKSITDFTLKVIVDVVIPDNALYFAGNESDQLTTTGKNITMGISNSERFIYLKSTLVNAFYLQAGDENLKSAEISYEYRDLKNNLIPELSCEKVENLECDRIFNPITKEYNYFYKVGITPKKSGYVDITAKMHKTNEIEQAYIAGNFDNMPSPSIDYNAAQLKLDEYNAFINKYITYFDTSDESYETFFSKHMSNGKVLLPFSAVEESKQYVFQTCKARISITAVNLSGITSTEDFTEFNVLTTQTFTLNQMINKFSLDVTLDQDDVANMDIEKSNLFGTLDVKPYVYVERAEYLAHRETLWKDYATIYGVDEFSNGKPVNLYSLAYDETEGFDGIGYMLLLQKSDTSYKDYITIKASNDTENKMWTIDFNVPMKNESIISLSDVKKALFLEFKVVGRDLSTNKSIEKNTFSRVYIQYSEYDFKPELEYERITFPESQVNPQTKEFVKRMALNQNVQNGKNQYINGSSTLSVGIDLKNILDNYNEIQYKSIMYFVEEKSNKIEGGGPKLASIGRYNFKQMNVSAENVDDMIKLYGTTENLIGERLPNRGTIENPDYYLRAVNASKEPAKIFAVVYLSDSDGNPIDINGRRIVIDESTTGGDPTTLVVFAITDVTDSGMSKVYVDNFVDNLNYYTYCAEDGEIADTYLDEEGNEITNGFYNYSVGYLKRNNINSYISPEGNEFSSTALEKIQKFLKIKFLYNNQITLYATNFELTSDGTTSVEEGFDMDTTEIIYVKDFSGKEVPLTLSKNTLKNKQLALDYMVANLDQFELSVKSTNSPAVKDTEIMRDEEGNVIRIKFIISVNGKSGGEDDYIKIKPVEGSTAIYAFSDTKDFVNWEVNKIKIESIELGTEDSPVSVYQKLYSRYGESVEEGQEFGYLQKDASNSLEFKNYNLYEFDNSTEIRHNSMEDNIPYQILTNLADEEGLLNLDIIDISQANYDKESEDTITVAEHYFKNIKEYIAFYTEDSNNMSISYLNPNNLYQLKDDMKFTNQNGDEFIYIADRKVEIQPGSITIDGQTYNEYITINGLTKGVLSDSNGKYIVLKAGEYFPEKTKDEDDISTDIIILILGEEFVIKTGTLQDGMSTYNYINNINEVNAYQVRYQITKMPTSKYNPHAYINDGTKDGSHRYSALVKDVQDNIVKSATVDFIRGGLQLDGNNQEIFITDENGNYKYDEITDSYVVATNSYQGIRYSKKGVISYVLITFNGGDSEGDAFEKPITKVLTYELVQEPVKLVAKDNTNSNGVELKNKDDSSAQILNIKAGQDYDINLKVGEVDATDGKYSIYLVGSFFQEQFYKHCSLTIESPETGIRFLLGGEEVTEITKGSVPDNNIVKLKIPSRYIVTKTDIKISYLYQGTTIEKYLLLNIENDYDFSLKSGVDVDTSGDNSYGINLDAEEQYNLQGELGLLKQYFNIGDDIDVKAEIVNSSKFATLVADNTLTIGKSYAMVDPTASVGNSNPQIIRDSFDIKLTLVKGGQELPVNKVLRVTINPTYTIDIRPLSNSKGTNIINILNGQSLFSSDYIKVYSGYGISEENEIKTFEYADIFASDLFELFEITSDGLGDECTSGIVSKDISSVDEIIDLRLRYTDEYTEYVDFKVNMRGYELYYSKDGELGLGDNQDRIDTYPDTLHKDSYQSKYEYDTLAKDLYLSNGQTINLLDYFAIFTANNQGNTNLYAVLIDSTDGNRNIGSIINETIITSGTKSYNLAIAYMYQGNYVVLKYTNYVINVKFVELFYASSGNMTTLNYTTLHNDSSYLINENLTITANYGDINIADYISAFNGSTNIEIGVMNGNSFVNTITFDSNLTEPLEICYKIGTKVYVTNYTVTFEEPSI